MIPYRISFNTIEGEVFWVDIGLSKFDKPFFDHVIDNHISILEAGYNTLTTSTETLLNSALLLPAVTPSGFVFHVSRCGSTLLSNALQQIKGATVISEAGILNTLFQSYLLSNSLVDSQFSKDKVKQFIQSVVTLLGHSQSESNRLFIKFSSWNILFLPLIQEIWPDVPIAFAFRDPFQVVESLIRAKPGWSNFFQNPGLVSAMLRINKKEVVTWAYIDFIVNILSGIYNAGKALEHNALFIHYSEDKVQHIKQLLDHFNVSAEENEWAAIRSGCNIYSKDPNQSSHYLQNVMVNGFVLNERVMSLVKTKLWEDYMKLKSFASVQP